MNIEKKYDYIIYSAGITGVLTALELSKKGKSVLLLNYYGFMGGSLTESLNCFQTVNAKNLNGSIKILFDKIITAKHGILYNSENKFLINPETLKIVLQEMIENSKVDLLFHIVPFYLKQKESFCELSVTGKEGIFNVTGKTIIDTSDEYDLLKLENVKRSLNELYCKMFLSSINNDLWKDHNLLNRKINLSDRRYWVSLKLPIPGNEFFIENNSQKIINDFEEVIQKSGGRIQMLAAQTQKIYSVDKLSISKNIFHIDSICSKEYDCTEVLSKASEVESQMSKLK